MGFGGFRVGFKGVGLGWNRQTPGEGGFRVFILRQKTKLQHVLVEGCEARVESVGFIGIWG